MAATKIREDHPVYVRALRREGRFWKGQACDAACPNSLHPILQRYKDECESGTDRFAYLASLGPFKKGLSIGCGSANVEIALMKRGIVKSFTFVDISEESLAMLERSLTPALKARSRILCQDTNFLELEEGGYDFIFCANVLHHVLNLEHVLLELNKALSPEGILLVDDFIGESRFQFSDERIGMINAIGAIVHKSTGVPFAPMARTSRKALINSCPFESIRSSDLHGLLRKVFAKSTVREKGYGAVSSWANVVLDMQPRAKREKDALDAALRVYVAFDRCIVENGVLPPLFLAGTYRKNPRPPRLSVQKWTKKEIRYHLPVRMVDERAAYLAGEWLALRIGRGRIHSLLRKAYMVLRK